MSDATISRLSSSGSLRRASSPAALLHPSAPPPQSPARRTTSSPSFYFQYTSLCDLLRSPSPTPTLPPTDYGAGAPASDSEKRDPVKVSSSGSSQDSDCGCDLWSRSTQTAPVTESSAQTDRDLYTADDDPLPPGGQSGCTSQRILGVQWDGSLFVLLGVLAVVIFTVAVIGTLSGTSRANKKLDSLDLMPDAFEGDPASAQQDVEVTTSSTAREAVTVLRSSDVGGWHRPKGRKAVSKVPKLVSKVREAVSKVSKAPRATAAASRRLKAKARKRGALSVATRPSTTPYAKRRSRPVTLRRRRAKVTVGRRGGPPRAQRYVPGRNLSTATIRPPSSRSLRRAPSLLALLSPKTLSPQEHLPRTTISPSCCVQDTSLGRLSRSSATSSCRRCASAMATRQSHRANVNKINRLDLVPDAFEREPASMQRGAVVTASSTARRTVTVIPRRGDGHRHTPWGTDPRAREKARTLRRRIKMGAKEHGAAPLPGNQFTS